jgi:hypothetical protein
VRLVFAIVLFLSANVTIGDEITRWVDSSGRVHYGNVPPPGSARGVQTLDVPDSFDEEAYEAGQQRLRETEVELEQYEREREAEEERKAREEAERKANIRQPPAFAGPRINLPLPEYEAPNIPGKPWIGYPGNQPRPPHHGKPEHRPKHKPSPSSRPGD